jgi:hypothetical protein
MNQNLVYFASVVVGAVLSYLINQLPGVPDAVKPWLWISVIGLTLLSAWLVIRSQAGSGNQTSSSRNAPPHDSDDVLVGVKGRNVRVKNVTVENQSGRLGNQRVASDLEAIEDIDLGDISVKK